MIRKEIIPFIIGTNKIPIRAYMRKTSP